ncbi:MAG: CoA-binding protein [Deltaproteobacteria bacterium HGW-Deltaproteobacteria-12]|jgi:acyl-CoA synthetase (NDP forming)|nr:MAG: CoA-binding protein [Deltaproteobacteria bacterium HGW-Deltaproteobacteria-12]
MAETDLFKTGKQRVKVSLTEAQSKEILKNYGVPVVEETVVLSSKEAVTRAGMMGFPVVLKGLGTKLTHKTERGLVKLNLRSRAEVQAACREIREAAGDDLEGFLLQPLIAGKREFVAGLFRDQQFGPVVMFGLGGVFTEALKDVVFRIAPLSETDAQGMIEEILSRKLLGAFRGEAAADQKQLIAVLTGLARLGIERSEIREVDINPLLISPDGRVTAVDALVIVNPADAADQSNLVEDRMPEEVRAINAALDKMTHARSIAFIGANRSGGRGFPGLFANIQAFGFPGKLYPINPRAAEINGIKAYPSLAALPEPVDLVVIAVPAPLVPAALQECVAFGCRNIHIFSSGFQETGEEEGERLQREIERIAREGKLNVIGPNCMGLYVPASRILTWSEAPGQSGPVSMISQSGGNAQDFTNHAAARFGIHFNKVISYGNALTLDSTDFLEYLGNDEDSRIIAMYLEGVKNGRRLLKLLAGINRVKPVIILKGGLTESGARAVSSHTGSMAGGEKIWDAVFRQSGAVKVNSLEEMAEVTLAFLNLREFQGRRVAVIGSGGGIGVAAADVCTQAGLDLCSLQPEVTQKLREFIPPAGNMIRNPIDAHILFMNLDVLGKTLSLLSSGYVDMFIISLHLDWMYDQDGGAGIEKVAAYLAQSARHYTNGKPLVVVWRQYRSDSKYAEKRALLVRILLQAGIPVYEGIPQAASALAKLASYHEFQRKHIDAEKS